MTRFCQIWCQSMKPWDFRTNNQCNLAGLLPTNQVATSYNQMQKGGHQHTVQQKITRLEFSMYGPRITSWTRPRQTENMADGPALSTFYRIYFSISTHYKLQMSTRCAWDEVAFRQVQITLTWIPPRASGKMTRCISTSSKLILQWMGCRKQQTVSI